MKTLTLSIKQTYFDEIITGTKKVETRELQPKNNKKYIEVDSEGFALVDAEDNIITRHYDQINFLTGAYSGTRPRMTVKVESSKVFLLEDEDGKLVELEDEKGIIYIAAVIEYQLGEIIEKPN